MINHIATYYQTWHPSYITIQTTITMSKRSKHDNQNTSNHTWLCTIQHNNLQPHYSRPSFNHRACNHSSLPHIACTIQQTSNPANNNNASTTIQADQLFQIHISNASQQSSRQIFSTITLPKQSQAGWLTLHKSSIPKFHISKARPKIELRILTYNNINLTDISLNITFNRSLNLIQMSIATTFSFQSISNKTNSN